MRYMHSVEGRDKQVAEALSHLASQVRALPSPAGCDLHMTVTACQTLHEMLHEAAGDGRSESCADAGGTRSLEAVTQRAQGPIGTFVARMRSRRALEPMPTGP